MSWDFRRLPESIKSLPTKMFLGGMAIVVSLSLRPFPTSSGADPEISGLTSADSKKIVLVAGKPSHPPRMHEFNAGVQILSDCLKKSGLPPPSM